MDTEVLIVGQGLSGSWLSWYLHARGISFKMIDEPSIPGASSYAAGLINPVTGRRFVTTWMIEELMPFAVSAYQEMGKFLGEDLIQQNSVIDFLPGVQMFQAFQHRMEKGSLYLKAGEQKEKFAEWFRYDFGWAVIEPCWLVAVEKLLHSWRQWLLNKNLLIESSFDLSLLQRAEAGIIYSGMRARYIVFCDGKSSANNPYFQKLPFALNKGEGLLVEIEGLPPQLTFKKGMSLIPYRENIFWLGSSYEWSFENDQPSEVFKKNAEDWLQNVLKIPFRIIKHFAAIRPATLERRPFVGFHPLFPSVGILNGMGTKGCSLSPYFANQLVDHISGAGAIDPLADISRFKNVLSR